MITNTSHMTLQQQEAYLVTLPNLYVDDGVVFPHIREQSHRPTGIWLNSSLQ